MSGVKLDNHPDSKRKQQELARRQMMQKLHLDILHDKAVCQAEGWDRMEYIRMLQELLNSFTDKGGKE